MRLSGERDRRRSETFDSLFQQVLSTEVTEFLPEWQRADPDVFQSIILLAKRELRVDYL